MSEITGYYNGFYEKLALIDAEHNTADKIKGFIPDLKPGIKILDMGCGYGSVSSEFIKAGCEVYGMEINKNCLSELKRKGFRIIEQDLSLPFQFSHTFDLILLLDVLEHVFDPLALLERTMGILNNGGAIVISVPLYFDLIDRLRILFTGKIVSYDNACYGKELYSEFRSYNYDHIRFFRPEEIFEMCGKAGLTVKKSQYRPMGSSCWLARLISNKYTVKLAPSLLAHSMVLRLEK